MSSVDMEMQICHQMFPPLRFMLRKLQLYLINILEIWLLCCEKLQRKRSHYCNLPPDPGDLVQLISQSALFPFMLPRYTLCGLVHSHELKDSKYKVQPGVTLWSHPLPHPPSPLPPPPSTSAVVRRGAGPSAGLLLPSNWFESPPMTPVCLSKWLLLWHSSCPALFTWTNE